MDIRRLCKQRYIHDKDESSDTESESKTRRFQVTLHPQTTPCELVLTSRHLRWLSDVFQVHMPLSDVLGCSVLKHAEQSVQVVVSALVRTYRVATRDGFETPRCKFAQTVSFGSASLADEFCSAVNSACSTVLVQASVTNRFAKPLLVVVNPKSGSGRSMATLRSVVQPIFQQANVPHETLCTEYAGHALQHISSCDLDRYSGIVALGGDGILYEIVNAMMSRADWRTARLTPIGILPGGSGNALATAVGYAAAESFRRQPLLSNLYVICKHQVLPFDLLLVQTQERFLFGFLEFSWGYVADVDIESESLRALGWLRFHLYGLYRVLFKRTKRARLTYLPHDEQEKPEEQDEFGQSDRHRLRYLPPLDQPIPTDDPRWRTLETDFFSITIQNRAFLTSESYIYQELRRFDPGFMIALILLGPVPRIDVLKQMVADEVVCSPYITTVKMKAFRFEPLEPAPTLLVVDGERVECGPLQAEVAPRAARILALMKDQNQKAD